MSHFLAVAPGTPLQEHAGSDKSLVWAAQDFAEGELKDELFTMRFGSVESELLSRPWLFRSVERELPSRPWLTCVSLVFN